MLPGGHLSLRRRDLEAKLTENPFILLQFFSQKFMIFLKLGLAGSGLIYKCLEINMITFKKRILPRQFFLKNVLGELLNAHKREKF